MLRPIGNKILVKPLYQDAVDRQMIAAMRSHDAEFVRKLAEEISPSKGLVLVKTTPPVTGTVIAIGRPFCEACQSPISLDIAAGDVVVYHPTAGMEIAIDGVAHVMMQPHDVLVQWRPDAKETV